MDRFSNLQKLLEQFVSMDAGPSGCALSVTKDGESLFEGYCGCADAESGRPVGPDTLYRTYSCTKVVTAAAFMLLLERGLVQLDDPVSEYLPEFKDSLVCHYTGNNMESLRPARSPMRLKHLVTMTSGLTYDGDLNTTQRAVKAIITDVNRDGMPLREFARRASRVPLRFEPGAGWNYGVSHDVLAAVIEVVSGKKFSEYLTDEFFTPLGMKAPPSSCGRTRRSGLPFSTGMKTAPGSPTGRRNLNSVRPISWKAAARGSSPRWATFQNSGRCSRWAEPTGASASWGARRST